jgi:hypothetical protein
MEPGPDFLGAVLRIGPERRRIRGDVEIHLRPSDWRRMAMRLIRATRMCAPM